MIKHNRVSKYTGVSWNKQSQKWRSQVSFNGVKYDCGYFDTDREAAKARDKKKLLYNMKKPLQILKRHE